MTLIFIGRKKTKCGKEITTSGLKIMLFEYLKIELKMNRFRRKNYK